MFWFVSHLSSFNLNIKAFFFLNVFLFLFGSGKKVLFLGYFEVYIYQIMGICVSNYAYVINSSWLEMHAHTMVINIRIMGKTRNWAVGSYDSQRNRMKIWLWTIWVSLWERVHSAITKKSQGNAMLASTKKSSNRQEVKVKKRGSKINLIQKATGNFPREETLVLPYRRTSRNTTGGDYCCVCQLQASNWSRLNL